MTAFAKRHLEGDRPEMPDLANGILGTQCYHLLGLNERIDGYTKMIEQHAMLDRNARRLMRMPGVGPITASAIVATVGDAKQFRTGRDFAAWLGLTPLNKSSGGKERLGKITKKGDRYIRKLLVAGHDVPRTHGEAKPGKGRQVDRDHPRREAVPPCDHGDGEQDGPDRLGASDETTGLPAAGGLTRRPAKRCKTLK